MTTQAQVTTCLQDMGAWYYGLPEAASTLKALFGQLSYATGVYIRESRIAPGAATTPETLTPRGRAARKNAQTESSTVVKNPAGASPTSRPRGRPPKAASTTGSANATRVMKSKAATGQITLADAALKCVSLGFTTAATILPELKRTYGMTVRPNHLAIALKRHLKAGRIEQSGVGAQVMFLPSTIEQERAKAA